MKSVRDITIEWGCDKGQHFITVRNGPLSALSGFADTPGQALKHLTDELPRTLEIWHEKELAREAFEAGSGYQPGEAPEAFEQWWGKRS